MADPADAIHGRGDARVGRSPRRATRASPLPSESRLIDHQHARTAEVRPLVVFAPGSFAPVREEVRRAFGEVVPGVPLRFEPPAFSGLLAARILAGAAADVFVSANLRDLDDLHRAGLVPEPRLLAGNRLCLVVRPDHVDRVRELVDLTRGGLPVVVPPSETDPLGEYAAEAFARAGLTEAIAAKRASGEVLTEVGDLPSLFAAGRAVAAVSYASWAGALAPAAVPVALPAGLDLHERVRFGVGAVAHGGDSHPAAAAFVEFLLGPAGQGVLARHGFEPRTAPVTPSPSGASSLIRLIIPW